MPTSSLSLSLTISLSLPDTYPDLSVCRKPGLFKLAVTLAYVFCFFVLLCLLLWITQGVQSSLPFSPCEDLTFDWHPWLFFSLGTNYSLLLSWGLHAWNIHSCTFEVFHNKSHCKWEPFLGEVIEFLIWRKSFPSPLLCVKHQMFQLMRAISDFFPPLIKKTVPFCYTAHDQAL